MRFVFHSIFSKTRLPRLLHKKQEKRPGDEVETRPQLYIGGGLGVDGWRAGGWAGEGILWTIGPERYKNV